MQIPQPLHQFALAGIRLLALAGLLSACASPTDSGGTHPALVRLSVPQLSLIRGEDSLVTAQVFASRERAIAGATVVWRSSAPGIVRVSGTGIVHAIYTGNATITATSGTASATVLVSVTDPFAATPARVRVVPPTAMLVGERQTVSALVLNKWNDVLKTVPVVWSSDAPATVMVWDGDEGVVMGLAGGSATITARAGGVSGSATIAVVPIDSVRIDVASQFVPGSSAPLAALAVGASGQLVRPITGSWGTSDPSVAALVDGGRVRAGRIGTATLTFTAGQLSASVAITSRPLPGVIAYVDLATGHAKFLTLDGADATTFGPTFSTTTYIASLSPDGATVAYNCGPNVCLAAPDGSKQRQLRVTPVLASAPSWSADGRVLAIQSGYNALVIVRDGNERTVNAPSGLARPHLSPDGGRVMYECETVDTYYDDFFGLCIGDLNAGPISIQLVIRDGAMGAWSRDGRIAFSSYDGLCVNDAVSLTSCQRLVWPDSLHGETESAWSPSGSYLVVRRRGELFVMEPSGANLVRLDKTGLTVRGSPSWGAVRP